MAWDRDPGDEPPPGWRDEAPDFLTPVDPNAPVSGHQPPPPAVPPSEAPEQDWAAAEMVLFPVLRPVGTKGTRLAELDPERLAAEGMKNHASPILDVGPSGLVIGYVLQAGAFDVHANADHLLAWGVTPAQMRARAMANLARWSASAAWTEEVSGQRRVISSAVGDGNDAARILLAEVRTHLATELGSAGRVLVGLPERELLVAVALSPGDEEFVALFGEFIRSQAEGADQPLDNRVHELVNGELRPFEG